MLVGMPVVFLLLFVYVFGGTLGAGLGGGRGGRRATTSTTSRPGILLMTVGRRRQRHRDLGRHGHDRGHHRPLPHHGDLPRLGADRARARQRHPDDDQPWSLVARRRAADRLPARRRRRSSGSAAVGLLVADRASRSPGWRSRSAWSAKTVEAASNLPMPLILLPFLGSGFVPDRLDAGRAALVRRVPAVHARSSRPCAAC